MYHCPACDKECITAMEKINASSVFPKTCRKCNNQYYTSRIGVFPLILSFDVLFWGSIFLALMFKSWLIFLAFPIGIFFVGFLTAKYTKLREITPSEVKRSRKGTALFVVFAALLFSVNYYVQSQ